VDLLSHYSGKSDVELIEVLEKKLDYTEEVVQIVLAEFSKRKMAQDFVIETAKIVYNELIKKIVADNGLTDIEHEFPQSHFLTQSEMMKIIKFQLEMRKELLRTTHDGAKRFRRGPK